MLLVEWQAWWEHLPAIEALEWLSSFNLHQAGDAGWTMDRETIISQKQELAALASARRPRSEDDGLDTADPWGVRRGVRRVFAWLKTGFGGGVGQG